ncbi:MAG: polysaccharide biosynthesis tyrosine autokinase [Proteobacteria bacterium]|nr:polysaccharide biosynthesis tyrosine autokinase [Pseudomonadota bacterium]
MEEGLLRVIHLKDFLRIIQKRKWLAIVFFSLLTIAGTVRTIMMEPVYRATIKILIERENPKVADIEEVYLSETRAYDYFATQYQIMQSRSVIREVINTLKLWDNPEFKGVLNTPNIIQRTRGKIYGFINNIKEVLKTVAKKVLGREEEVRFPVQTGGKNDSEQGSGIDPFAMTGLIDAYWGKFFVEPIEETRLVNISFEGQNPMLITEIVNTHAKVYMEHNLKMRYEANKIAGEWLKKGLDELRIQGEKAQLVLQKFKEKEDIVMLDSALSKYWEGENIIFQKLAQLNNELTQAKMKRIQLETVYDQLKKIIDKPEEINAFPEIIQDSTIRSLKNDYTALMRDYSELSEKYGPKHPKIVSLKSEIEEQKKRLRMETEQLGKTIETQYVTAKANEEKLEKTLNGYKQEVMDVNKKAAVYGILKKDVEYNRDLYEMFQKRLGETSIVSDIEASNIFILDSAEVPSMPVRPNRTGQVLFSAFLGLLGGIGLTFIFEYFDNTIKGQYDIDMYLRRLPFLGPIGSFSTLEGELITLIKPESNFSESFRNVRTNLFLNAPDKGYKTYLITSPGRGEGKTLVSANLAIAMTQNSKKVLLIDTNMRMPRLYSLLGVENSPGLSDFLKGKVNLDTILKPTGVESVTIITAGTIPLDPLELLSSESMHRMMEEVKKRFDFIIIDSPGMLVGPDATVTSRLSDGVVFLTQFAKTPRTLAKQAIDQLSNLQAKLLGVVINNIDYKRGQYHFPYYKWLLKADSRIDMYMVERITS